MKTLFAIALVCASGFGLYRGYETQNVQVYQSVTPDESHLDKPYVSYSPMLKADGTQELTNKTGW